MEHTQAEFDTALATWLDGYRKIYEANFEQYEHVKPDRLELQYGSRYVKVVKVAEHGGKSVCAFIDRTNGDILKAASWKAPAKHKRGSLFDESNGLACMTPYGPAYLR